MGKYILEARNDKNSHDTSLSAFKIIKADFLPAIGADIYIDGDLRVVESVIHTTTKGSIPKVLVKMPKLFSVKHLIEDCGWKLNHPRW